MLGRRFGRYRIVGRLGQGGMGTVWKAEDELLGRSVALKLLNASLAGSGDARARLLREARAAGALDHPGIGTVYDVGEQDGEVFIAMRYVEGGTVADRIAELGPIAVVEAMRIAASAADALACAHANGILHRDVSARNFMLTGDGQVVIVDFGLALAEDASRLTKSGATFGTAHYIAPEIALGKQADRRSDVYSLGAVLYEMLTGSPPFAGDRVEAVLYAAVHTPPVPPSHKRQGIPTELDRIVLRSLAKAPEDRYASMEALRDDLEALGVTGGSSEQETTVLPIARSPGARVRWRSRRVAVFSVAALIVVAAGLVTAWLATRVIATTPRYGSIAVLPFNNLSAKSPETDYLSDGLSQTLINKLTQTSSIRVPPWMTVGRFKRSDDSPVVLAKKLNVEAILVGAYELDGQRVRGTISIIDGKTGEQVWTDGFDQPLADLLELQNRIAVGAATKLLGRLSGKQAEVLAIPAAASIDAYEHYLKGSRALQLQTQNDCEEALGLFQRAIQIDPNYAPAWVGIGAAHTDRYTFGWNGGLKDLASAEEAFGKALAIDHDSLAARRGLIRVNWYRGKQEECLKQGKLIASSGARGTETNLARAEGYMFGGLAVRALPLLRQVMAEEPANPAAPWLMTVAGEWADSCQEAVAAGERFLSAFGEDSEVRAHSAACLERLGKLDEAESYLRRALKSDPDRNGVELAMFLRRQGRLDEADRAVLESVDMLEDKLQRAPDNCWLRVGVGGVYGLAGDTARMHEEEARIRRDLGDGALFDLPTYEIAVGDPARAVELWRSAIRAGNVADCHGARGPSLDPDAIKWPGYKELAADQALECKRLEALY